MQEVLSEYVHQLPSQLAEIEKVEVDRPQSGHQRWIHLELFQP
jgi:hypothetical protein